MKYSVVIVAAGMGSRMNLGYNKMFYRFKTGQTVLEKTVNCFTQHPNCNQIIIVTQKEDFEKCKFITDKSLTLVEGGSTRQESVVQGLAEVVEDFVFVHDGARPYLQQNQLDDLVSCLKSTNACLLAVPCKDTIKVVQDSKVIDTPLRSTLYQAQTPQAFKTELLRECYKKSREDSAIVTDDASVVERYGNTEVKIVQGSYSNIKITTPEDLD